MEDLRAYESAMILGLVDDEYSDAVMESIFGVVKDKVKAIHRKMVDKKLAKDKERVIKRTPTITMEEYKSTWEPRVNAAIKEISASVASVLKEPTFSIKLKKLTPVGYNNWGYIIIPFFDLEYTTTNQNVRNSDDYRMMQPVHEIAAKYSMSCYIVDGNKGGYKLSLLIPSTRCEGMQEFDPEY